MLDDIELAVGEALANAVEHGRQDEAGFIEVILRRDMHSLVIEIKDNGRGFDHGSSVHRRPSAGALRGFGTFIMREFMDEIEYSERGTRLRLTKRLPARMAQRSAMQA
jgi:anti-sigma regulatory factor (Ser/Thr protein kinase)